MDALKLAQGLARVRTLVALIGKLLDGTKKKLKIRLLTFTRAATAELADKVGGIKEVAVETSQHHSFIRYFSACAQHGCGRLPRAPPNG